jgi:hypothetical protein
MVPLSVPTAARRIDVNMQTDDKGRRYLELDRPRGEKTRLTYIPDPNWLDRPVMEIRVEEADGRLAYGPQIPVDDLGDLVAGIFALLTSEYRRAD